MDDLTDIFLSLIHIFLIGEGILQGADPLAADAGPFVRSDPFIVFCDTEGFHPLSLLDVLRKDHVFDRLHGLVEQNRILRLGGRAAGHFFHFGGNRGAEFFFEERAEFLQPLDVYKRQPGM